MQFEKWIPVDLMKSPFHVLDIGMPVCTGDNNSVRLGVQVTSNGAPVDVTGTIKGYVTLPNGLGIMPFDGAKDGNRAWIDLPEDALGMSGRISIAIRSFDTDQTTVLLLASATVRRVDADQYYDPTDIVGDITDLIEDAEQAAQDAEAALAQATQIVSYAEQTGKTDAQKAQARTNIGAASTGEVTDLKSALDAVVDYSKLSSYLYKTDTYVNDSGVETTLQGHNLYKIPIIAGDLVRFSWSALSTTPWGTLPNGHPINIHKTDDTYVNFGTAAGTVGRVNTTNKEAIFVAPSNADYVVMAVKPENAGEVQAEKNHPTPALNDGKKLSLYNTVFVVNEQSAIRTQFYVDNTGKYQILGNTVCVFALPLKSGDEAVFQAIPSGVSFRGTYLAQDGTCQNIGSVIAYPYTFSVASDGMLFAFAIPSGARDTVVNPKTQIVISSKNVYGLSDGSQFDGLSGVAFGTSLTYNASVGNGYLTRLSSLSGITFDNQGVGSSTILGDGGSLDMLAKIKAYTGYSGKRVCLLEGFVNDWYGQNPLGTWQDNDETTVCGCVRSALNYMLTQNANMTVFLILDHYGKSYSTLDCSSTVKRNNLTQFEYYSEIAKVAKSLGIPVIREFELSGISELMPQYLADNIHLNALGAIQSANVIWNEMKLRPLNAD